MIKKPNFFKGNPIRLENGAIIIPLIQATRRTYACEGMIECQKKTRWAKCLHQEKCIDAVQKFDGFSCEDCPLKDKSEHAFTFSQARALQDALQCSELWSEAFKDGAK